MNVMLLFLWLWGKVLSVRNEDHERDIAMSNGYDWTWPRPADLSMTHAIQLGLVLSSSQSSAWEGGTVGSNQGDIKWSNNNLGNLIWAAGVTNLLAKSEWQKVDMIRSRVLAKNNHTWRALILGTGPIISWKGCTESIPKFKYMMDMISATSKNTPIFLFGLGILGMCRNFNSQHGLMANSQALAELIQSRLESAGGLVTTRGMYTWNMLRWGGLISSNFLPICGPSLFLNTTQNLGKIIQNKYHNILNKLVKGRNIRVGINTNHDKYSQVAIRTLIVKLLEQGHSVIEVMQDLSGHSSVSDLNISTRRFYNVETWISSLRTEIDIYVGARIHGSMAAVAAGIPAITLVTDFRQSEFVSCVDIVHIDAHKTLELFTNNGIVAFFQYAAMSFDGGNFDQIRFSAALDYARAFDEIGIQLNPSIRALAGNYVRKPLTY